MTLDNVYTYQDAIHFSSYQAKSQNQVSKQASPETSLNALLKKMGPEIQHALPKHMDADRIARIALTAVRTQLQNY
ncbi:hypothetical protein [Lysinibacillus fusiformis]